MFTPKALGHGSLKDHGTPLLDETVEKSMDCSSKVGSTKSNSCLKLLKEGHLCKVDVTDDKFALSLQSYDPSYLDVLFFELARRNGCCIQLRACLHQRH